MRLGLAAAWVAAQGTTGRMAMPRYYFVLSSRDGFVEDLEGTELPDLAAAQQEAAMDLAHLRQPRIGGRRSWAGWAMQVRDEGGTVLLEMPFTRSAARARRQRGGGGTKRPQTATALCCTAAAPNSYYGTGGDVT